MRLGNVVAAYSKVVVTRAVLEPDEVVEAARKECRECEKSTDGWRRGVTRRLAGHCEFRQSNVAAPGRLRRVHDLVAVGPGVGATEVMPEVVRGFDTPREVAAGGTTHPITPFCADRHVFDVGKRNERLIFFTLQQLVRVHVAASCAFRVERRKRER